MNLLIFPLLLVAAFLIAKKPRVGITALVGISLMGPTQQALATFELDKIFGILLLASFVAASFTYRWKWRKSPLDAPIVFLAMAGALTCASLLAGGSDQAGSTLGELLSLAIMMITCLVVFQLARTMRSYTAIMDALAIGGAIVALISFGLVLAGIRSFWLGDVRLSTVDTWGSVNRLGGIYGQPNTLALIMIIAAPVGIFHILSTHKTRRRLFWGGISGVCLLLLLMTQSRSGIIGLSIGGLFAGALILKKRIIRGKALIPAALVILALFIAFLQHDMFSPLLYRFSREYQMAETFGNPNENRITYWRTVLDMAAASPLGNGSYASILLGDTLGFESKGTHNVFIGFLAQYGVLGLVGIAWLAINMLKSLWRAAIRAKTREQSLYILCLLMAVIAFWAHNMAHSIIQWAVIWVFFAVAVAAESNPYLGCSIAETKSV